MEATLEDAQKQEKVAVLTDWLPDRHNALTTSLASISPEDSTDEVVRVLANLPIGRLEDLLAV